MTKAILSDAHPTPARSTIDAAWFVKRTIVAVIILFLSIGTIAWLLHASIDPTLDATAAEARLGAQNTQTTGSIGRR